jgi:predicted RNase H-like HicB family nuclease
MKKTVKELQFKVIIEQDEDGWYVASVPELEGCYTQGKTVEQVRDRIKEVIKLVLDSDKQAAREKLTRPMSMSRFLGFEDISIRYAQT